MLSKSYSLGYAAAAITALAAGVIVLWLVVPRLGTSLDTAPTDGELSRQVVVTVDKPIEDKGRPLTDGEWIDADKEGIRQVDLFIRLEEVKADRLPEKDAVSYLLINFRLTDNKLQRKNAFAGFGKGKAEPKLTDASGRSYAFLGHRPRKLRNKFDMGVNEDQWLIFELPPAGSSPLRLEVPASSWGRTGACRFTIKSIDVEETPDMPTLIAKYKAILKSPPSAPPDLALGRMLFTRTCVECHILFDFGSKIGPELTDLKLPDGRTKRNDLDFLVANIVDPSLEIAKEFQPSVVVMDDGKVHLGIVKEQTSQNVVLQTASKILDLKRAEIEDLKESKISIMPVGLLKELKDPEVRALFAYVMSPRQTPLLATPENRGYFFSERDLELRHFWHAEGGAWKTAKSTPTATTEVIAPGPENGKPALLVSDVHIADDFHVAMQFTPGAAGGGAVLIREEGQPLARDQGPRIEFAAGRLSILDRKGASVTLSKDASVQPDAWNKLEVIGVGPRLEIKLNGKQAATIDVPAAHRFFALEGPAMAGQDVRFKNLDLHMLGK